MDTAAVPGRNAHTLGEQVVIIALTPFKAAGGAASEARESSTGALAGACANRVVAVGRTLESCGERRQGEGGRQSPNPVLQRSHSGIQTATAAILHWERRGREDWGDEKCKTECQAWKMEMLG